MFRVYKDEEACDDRIYKLNNASDGSHISLERVEPNGTPICRVLSINERGVHHHQYNTTDVCGIRCLGGTPMPVFNEVSTGKVLFHEGKIRLQDCGNLSLEEAACVAREIFNRVGANCDV